MNEDLELEDHSLVILPDLLHEQLEENGDLESYASVRAAQFVATFGGSLLGALDPDRSEDDRRSLSEYFTERLTQRVKDRPGDAECHWRVYQLLIAKAW